MALEVVYGTQCRDDAAIIRTYVFMEEQGYSDEFDQVDETCIHVVAYKDNVPVGCARVFPEQDNTKRYVIGRVAVLKEMRHNGIGRMLVDACEEAAQKNGATELSLHAQARLEPWYESMGYRRFGEVDYEDEDQPHVWMEKYINL